MRLFFLALRAFTSRPPPDTVLSRSLLQHGELRQCRTAEWSPLRASYIGRKINTRFWGKFRKKFTCHTRLSPFDPWNWDHNDAVFGWQYVTCNKKKKVLILKTTFWSCNYQYSLNAFVGNKWRRITSPFSFTVKRHNARVWSQVKTTTFGRSPHVRRACKTLVLFPFQL